MVFLHILYVSLFIQEYCQRIAIPDNKNIRDFDKMKHTHRAESNLVQIFPNILLHIILEKIGCDNCPLLTVNGRICIILFLLLFR